jgi:hypothetical protein
MVPATIAIAILVQLPRQLRGAGHGEKSRMLKRNKFKEGEVFK